MNKTFTAISTESLNDKLVILNASNGQSLTNKNGIPLIDILEFFYTLRCTKQEKETFVCYAFQKDAEYIFSQLPNDLKDKLFQSYQTRRQIGELETELEELEYQFWNTPTDLEKFENATFDKWVNELALKDLLEVEYKGFKLRLISGKLLTVSKKGKRFILFDIYGFFRKPLYKVIQEWFQEDLSFLKRSELQLTKGLEIKQLKAYSDLEVKQIERLIGKFNKELLSHGITLSNYHGVTAISSWLLSSRKARTEYHSYRKRRQYTGELYKATHQSYYGGRIEQFKIGTFNKEVNVYDLNSAYGFACSMLPTILRKPIFTQDYTGDLFSIWFCEYDFTNVNHYYSYLPTRDTRRFIIYKPRGRGYFWQPEIDWVMQNFPQCINIKQGFVFPYEKAKFTEGITELYNLRIKLQAINHPLAKTIKLAIAGIYGKFKQEIGRNHYYNLFYSGFITSLTSAMLLEGAKGKENKTICFLTDAIHTTAKLKVPVSNEMGEWKKETYDKAVYLNDGVYRLYKGNEIIKEKTKGFHTFDFDAALSELQRSRTYTALMEFFIGYNLYSFMPVAHTDYLKLRKQEKTENPFELKSRLYESVGIDLTKTHCESKMFDTYAGRESALYVKGEHKENDLGKDSIMAERI